jgi:hypothetical protein
MIKLNKKRRWIMPKDNFDIFIEGVSQYIKAASEQASPHFQGVIKASEVLVSDLKTTQKAFKEKEKRVERKLKSGIRRTQGDPV